MVCLGYRASAIKISQVQIILFEIESQLEKNPYHVHYFDHSHGASEILTFEFQVLILSLFTLDSEFESLRIEMISRKGLYVFMAHSFILNGI
jgi:hypothetical protein